jgi:hypothetical protein
MRLVSRNRSIFRIFLSIFALLGIVAGLILVGQQQIFRNRAASLSARLSMTPLNASLKRGDSLNVDLILNSTSQPISGTDVIVQFDNSYLTLNGIDTYPQNSSLKTYVPVTSNGSFDSTKVLSEAQTSGRISFGAVAYDQSTNNLTQSFEGVINSLARLRFSVKNNAPYGSTQISYVYSGARATDDSNVVIDPNVGGTIEDILIQPTDSTTVNVVSSQTPTTPPSTTPSPTSTPPPSASFPFEVGKLTLSNTIDSNVSQTISFNNSYANPIVVAYIMTRGDGQSVDVRVRNVTSNSANIFMEEPDNGTHNPEEVGYIVMEQGKYSLPDGTKVEAGKQNTNSVHRGGSGFSGTSVSFTQPFNSPPVLLHTISTYNNNAFMTSVSPSVSASGFSIQQEAAETGSTSVSETIGWIAIESGKSGIVDGVAYQTGRGADGSPDGVDNPEHVINYPASFTQTPIIIVDGYTGNGGDGYWARGSGTNSSSKHGTYSEEDQRHDSERGHIDEGFSWWAIEKEINTGGGAGGGPGPNPTPTQIPTPTPPPTGGVSASLSCHQDHVDLTASGTITTYQYDGLWTTLTDERNGQVIIVSFDAVSSGQGNIGLLFHDRVTSIRGATPYLDLYGDGRDYTLKVYGGSYTALEPYLQSGDLLDEVNNLSQNCVFPTSTPTPPPSGTNNFEVGKLTLSDTIDQNVTQTVNFTNSYTNPIVVAYIMTRGGDQSVDVRVGNVTSNSANIFMEEPDNEGHNPEEVGYIVMEQGQYSLPDGTKVEAGKLNTNSVHREPNDFSGTNVNFNQSFSSAPVVLHTLNTYNNNAFMTSVSPSVSASGFSIQQEAGGSPTGSSATTETIGWIAIESGKSGSINGVAYQTGRGADGSPDGVDNRTHTINYSPSFSQTPIIVVDGYTGNGLDGYWARGSENNSSSRHGTYAEEDQQGDTERGHIDEGFSWWAIESAVTY